MKRFTAGLLNRSKSHDGNSPPADSPEANVVNAIRAFCESGAANSNDGEEVLHLPVIVEAAESSPSAAASAAYQLRKFLSKDNSATRPYIQYNAIMLIRILSDNPGETFTRNIDAKFVATVKDLLKNGRDASVQQILRETLDSFEAEKSYDEGLAGLITMWRSEKGRSSHIAPSAGARNTSNFPNNFHVPAFNPHAPPLAPSQQEPSQRVFGRNQLPPPHELASRVEEAKNTAKLLLQLLQSTPPDEVLSNDLMKEFAERCQTAQRSVQEYINCDSPPPDDDTLQTLIEVNEQLSLALSRHQRAILSARRATGATSVSPHPPMQDSAYAPPPQQQQSASMFAPPVPQRNNDNNMNYSDASVHSVSPIEHETFHAPPGPPPSKSAEAYETEAYQTNPFQDPSNTYAAYTYPKESDHFTDSAPDRKPAPQHLERPASGGAYFQGSTPSYLGRQSSAAQGLTMHGGVDEPESIGHNPWAGQQQQGQQQQQHNAGDVSPIEARAPVTYRY